MRDLNFRIGFLPIVIESRVLESHSSRGFCGAHAQNVTSLVLDVRRCEHTELLQLHEWEVRTEKKGGRRNSSERLPVYIVLSTISAEGAFVLTD